MVLGRLEDEKRGLREEVLKKESGYAAERQVAGQAMLKREAELEAKVKCAEEGRRLAQDDVHRYGLCSLVHEAFHVFMISSGC